jgi:choline dehydrogenase-like flavoprotein
MIERAVQAHDAIIIGSGPTGGWCAKTLTAAGMNVLVLEAGTSWFGRRARDVMHRVRCRTGYRVEEDTRALARQWVQSSCYAWRDSPGAFVDDADNPYSTPEGRPFTWIRARQVGGRMLVRNHGLHFYRLSDLDFKAARHDGFGADWPLSYAELRPFYDRVERSMGLSGNGDGIAHLPDPIPGPPVALTPGEQHLATRIAERWRDRRLIARRTSLPPAPIQDALATRRLELRHSAVAREILIDPGTGRPRGVAWLEDGRQREASARVIVLAASTIESTRLLLNSRSRHHPEGLGNSSGMLGRCLMDHTYLAACEGTLPPYVEADAKAYSWGYIPQFRNVQERSPGFLRGYGVQVFTLGRYCQLWAFGEMLPRETNRVTIDPEIKDRWGIPAVRIECEHSDNERAQIADAVDQCREMLAAAGCEIHATEPVVRPPGTAIHEVGTARMGHDPRTSVLDPHNRCWDADNLFVVDGACFASQGPQNPTLTMMALALRASEHIVKLLRRYEL